MYLFQDHPRGPITLSLQAHLDKTQSAETEAPKMQGEWNWSNLYTEQFCKKMISWKSNGPNATPPMPPPKK